MAAAAPAKPAGGGAQREHRWQLPPNYEIKQVIGTGSYGSVCEAQDSQRGRLVAVKRVRHMFDDLVDCKRILREVAIISSLSHEGVVQLYDVIAPGTSNSFDEIYMVMEICDSDLKKLCRTDVNLTSLHINTLLYNLLVGVKYLHSAGIYHRDLKPANCLVNQDCSVKICDFGLSRAIGAECQDGVAVTDPLHNPGGLPPQATVGGTAGGPRPVPSRRHLTGHVVTRWYRAPELILLQTDYTAAIDLWSVGCIYAELIGMLDGTRMEDRGPLFPGSSCFPLSPDNKHKSDYKYHVKGKHDQLSMIFNLLGTPSDSDIERLEREDARRYIQCFAKRQGAGLLERFPQADREMVDILERLLRFAPQERMDVDEALAHGLFLDIREPAKETTAKKPINLDFEREPDLDEALLRQYFCAEIRRLRGRQDDNHRIAGA